MRQRAMKVHRQIRGGVALMMRYGKRGYRLARVRMAEPLVPLAPTDGEVDYLASLFHA